MEHIDPDHILGGAPMLDPISASRMALVVVVVLELLALVVDGVVLSDRPDTK